MIIFPIALRTIPYARRDLPLPLAAKPLVLYILPQIFRVFEQYEEYQRMVCRKSAKKIMKILFQPFDYRDKFEMATIFLFSIKKGIFLLKNFTILMLLQQFAVLYKKTTPFV